ncbi:hypothetical protein GJV26_20205 [Massilia dura]|uniref:Uncharacterized protein n=1 Tax=Pseudoduganella dura TaxID=321982 RepID=A0A6I3XEB6_9BURK|nr:hypothetical protein [Pseudoduganella dura]MUI14767.1 hypothetical protein [Pseudoduganella dura]GGX98189.1 hypothetical protein GCM10007386_31330 [Pseudoduganella dura]
MHAVFISTRRHPRLALFAVALAFVLAASLAWGGMPWLLMVPVTFMLGRSYGTGADLQDMSGQPQYGVGAALAGFTPAHRD